MALPITVPYTFGNATTAIPLSNLDSDYATVYQAVNGIGNGSVALANVTITGGTVSNVSGVVPTPFTANGVVYASSTSALATGSGITYNGTTFSTTNDASINGLTVGRGAGAVSTNTAVGASALSGGSLSGFRNIGIGQNTGNTISTGAQNTFVGSYCGTGITTGSTNVGIGDGSLGGNSSGASGSSNTGVGTGALTFVSSGSNNVALGYSALNSNTTASNNTAVGYQAGYPLTTSSYNVFLGYLTGLTVATGSGGNIHVGNYLFGSSSTATNEFVIGSYGQTGKGNNTGFISPGGGGVYQGNNSAAWSITSDQRLKKNIVDNNVGLDKVIQIQVRNFEYRTEDEVTDLPKNQAIKKQGIQLGVIAQELQQVLPDCVKQESTGVLAVDSTDIMYHMINAIKELNAEIQALKAKVGI